MSDSHTPDRSDRALQRSLSSKIIDEYFNHTESWLRAILRMSIFSLTQINEQSALLIECPNQAVAKRLSRKTSPLQQVVPFLSNNYCSNYRVLICYQKAEQKWQCFDTNTNTWNAWETSQTPATPE